MDSSTNTEDSLRERERDLVAALGERIVRLRQAKGWSRTILARRLGVSRGRLGHWERGGHAPPIVIQMKLSRVLGVPFGELVTGEARKEPRWSPETREELGRHLEGLRRLLLAAGEPGDLSEEEDDDWLRRWRESRLFRPIDPNG